MTVNGFLFMRAHTHTPNTKHCIHINFKSYWMSCLTLFFSKSCCSFRCWWVCVCVLFFLISVYFHSCFELGFFLFGFFIVWYMSLAHLIKEYTQVAWKPHTQKPFGCQARAGAFTHISEAAASWRQVSGISEIKGRPLSVLIILLLLLLLLASQSVTLSACT